MGSQRLMRTAPSAASFGGHGAAPLPDHQPATGQRSRGPLGIAAVSTRGAWHEQASAPPQAYTRTSQERPSIRRCRLVTRWCDVDPNGMPGSAARSAVHRALRLLRWRIEPRSVPGDLDVERRPPRLEHGVNRSRDTRNNRTSIRRTRGTSIAATNPRDYRRGAFFPRPCRRRLYGKGQATPALGWDRLGLRRRRSAAAGTDEARVVLLGLGVSTTNDPTGDARRPVQPPDLGGGAAERDPARRLLRPGRAARVSGHAASRPRRRDVGVSPGTGANRRDRPADPTTASARSWARTTYTPPREPAVLAAATRPGSVPGGSTSPTRAPAALLATSVARSRCHQPPTLPRTQHHPGDRGDGGQARRSGRRATGIESEAARPRVRGSERGPRRVRANVRLEPHRRPPSLVLIDYGRSFGARWCSTRNDRCPTFHRRLPGRAGGEQVGFGAGSPEHGSGRLDRPPAAAVDHSGLRVDSSTGPGLPSPTPAWPRPRRGPTAG